MNEKDTVSEPSSKPADQFAKEIDHFAECILTDREPFTPGEEGLQDMRIIEALYRSASSGSVVRLDAPPRATRGPAPAEA